MNIILVGGSRGLGKDIKRIFLGYAPYNIVSLERKDLDLTWGIEDIKKVINKTVKKRLGGVLDCLIVSSGMGAYYGPVIDEQKIKDMFQVNVFGPMACYRAAQKYLFRSKGKAIVITSTAARRPGSGGLSIYAAAKGAVNSWIISEGRRAAKRGVALCAVAPGFFWSDMTEQMAPELVKKVEAAIPFGRFGEVEEISGFVVSLLLQSNWALAGQIYELSGGA